MTPQATQQAPLAKPPSTTGVVLQRRADAGNDRSQNDSNVVSPFAQCPSVPVDAAKVQKEIHDVLSATGGDVQLARDVIHGLRERTCCDVDLAAVEHYLYAREQVGAGPLPFEIDSLRMTVAILAQAAAKILGVMPRTGRCPVTPFSTEQLKWEMKGVEDGIFDAQKARTKKGDVPLSTISPAIAPVVPVSEQADPVRPKLQTKLTVNSPGDKYEQEADRVAEQVMRMPEPKVQRQCACGKSSAEGECTECKKKKQEATGSLQRVASSPVGGIVAPPIVNSVLSSPGSPLPTSTRSFMESRFGHDFSHVRVHTDQQAAMSARSINARAYTLGHHIAFGIGESPTGDGRLVAHELAHVVQQGGARTARPRDNSFADHFPDQQTDNSGIIRRQGRGDRGAEEGREEGRETRTSRAKDDDNRRERPAGGRDRRDRRRDPTVDFESDWAGRAILERYLAGEGDWDIADSPQWTEYLKRSDILRAQLRDQVMTIATTIAQGGQNGVIPVASAFPAELENGEGIIGYQYLHGTNRHVGDFQINGLAEVKHVYGQTRRKTETGALQSPVSASRFGDLLEIVEPSATLRLQVRYTWNDIIDPNPKYGTDTVKSVVAELITLGEAEAYRISISWSDECTVLIPEGGAPKISGFPGD